MIESRVSVSWLSIFTSSSTLVCCALPAVLVALGAGAALSSLVGAVPQIVWLSEHKLPLFILAGLMLAAAGALQWHARRLACPTDPSVADACANTRDWSLIVTWVSVAMFMTGAMFAFIVPLFI